MLDKLILEFPQLFKMCIDPGEHGPHEPITLFGIECWPGWYNIIYQAAKEVDSCIQSLPIEEQTLYYFVQIKSKFAVLEMYMSNYTEEITVILLKAKEASKHTCEKCGRPGKLCGTNWLYTLCKSCEIQRTKERGRPL